MWKFRRSLLAAAMDDGDPASLVRAPGQEAFKTPDLKQGEEVSVDNQTQFGSDIDWDATLDDDDDEEITARDSAESSVDTSELGAETSDEDDDALSRTPKENALEETETIVSDAEAAAAVATDEDEFQPQPLSDMGSEGQAQDPEARKTYEASRKTAIKELTARYQLSEEENDLLMTDPGKVLPELVARSYVDVFESVVGAVNQMLPVSVGRVQKEVQLASEYTNQFYSAWPMLQTPEGEKKVLAIGKTYREHNRDATPEDFIQDVGVQAAIALKLPIPGVTADIVKTTEELSPAGPAGRGGAATPVADTLSQSGNQFERLHTEWDDDDV